MNPAAPALVYMITSEAIFKSDDAGATWLFLGQGLPGALALNFYSLTHTTGIKETL